MTTDEARLALRSRLRDLLGTDETTTLWAMLHAHDDLVTKADLASMVDGLRAELKAEMAATRTELKTEIAGIRADLSSFIRTFITVQAATVVGATGIVYALFRLT